MFLSRFSKFPPGRKCFCASQIFLRKRCLSSKSKNDENNINNASTEALGNIGSKYKIFRDQDSEVILDLYEERLKKYGDLLEQEEKEIEDPLEGLNLERGLHGVFDIEDLVEILKRENAVDIFVARIPKEIKYVDFICVVSGKSQRHLQAMAQFVRKVYKKRRHENDRVPILEGADSKDWMAIDLGNIALHLFSKEARLLYDLDSLWSVGPQFDKEFNKKDQIVDMLEKYSYYLKDLQPAT